YLAVSAAILRCSTTRRSVFQTRALCPRSRRCSRARAALRPYLRRLPAPRPARSIVVRTPVYRPRGSPPAHSPAVLVLRAAADPRRCGLLEVQPEREGLRTPDRPCRFRYAPSTAEY